MPTDRDLADDPDDGRFRRAFDRLAGPSPDPHVELAAFHRRAASGPTASQRSPRLAVALAAAATVAFLVAVGHRGDDQGPAVTARPAMTVAPPPTVTSTTHARAVGTVGGPSPTANPAPSDSTGPDPSPPGTTDPSPERDEPTVSGGSTARRAPTATVGSGSPVRSAPASSAVAPSLAPATTAGPVPPAATAPPPARTFGTVGGTVTVRVVDGAFQAPVVVTDAGWTAEVRKAEAERVEVRFRAVSSDGDMTLKLSLGRDGSIVVEGD